MRAGALSSKGYETGAFVDMPRTGRGCGSSQTPEEESFWRVWDGRIPLLGGWAAPQLQVHSIVGAAPCHATQGRMSCCWPTTRGEPTRRSLPSYWRRSSQAGHRRRGGGPGGYQTRSASPLHGTQPVLRALKVRPGGGEGFGGLPDWHAARTVSVGGSTPVSVG